MTVTAMLDLRLKAESLEASYRLLHEILVETRAFAGCEGVEVSIDTDDPTHVLLVERWESMEADAAYRRWRAGAGASALRTILAAPPGRSHWAAAPQI